MINVDNLIELSDEHIEDILTSLNIEYKHEDDWVVMNCCFHEMADGWNLKYRDKSFYCFSQCRRSYSIINVVEKVLDVGFVEASKWLCKELNIKDDKIVIDKEKVAVKAKLKRLRSLKHKKQCVEYKLVEQEVLNDIERYDHPYMLQKGFSRKTLEYFNIGYARNGTLEGRITFPIDSPSGDIISVSGRLPTDDDIGLPKYKVLGNTDKSTTLYNISRINPSDDYVIVVEGFNSVMSLYEYGFKSCVATMGSSLSVEQRNLLLKLGRKIIVIGDNDDAGNRMAQSVYNQCYRFCDCIKIDLKDISCKNKDSPCQTDLGFDGMVMLCNKIEEVI